MSRARKGNPDAYETCPAHETRYETCQDTVFYTTSLWPHWSDSQSNYWPGLRVTGANRAPMRDRDNHEA